MFLQSVLTVIGGLVVLMVSTSFIVEVVRAARNSHRVATVAVRTKQRRKPSLKEWWFAFKKDLYSGYSELQIGWIGIPHNPSVPLRNRLPRH